MPRKDKLIMHLPFFEDASHDHDAPYRARALLSHSILTNTILGLGLFSGAAALASEVPEGTENAVLTGSAALIVSALIKEAYILLHWNPNKLPHKVMARRLEALDRGFLARARREDKALDVAQAFALSELEAQNRPPVLYFKSEEVSED